MLESIDTFFNSGLMRDILNLEGNVACVKDRFSNVVIVT